MRSLSLWFLCAVMSLWLFATTATSGELSGGDGATVAASDRADVLPELVDLKESVAAVDVPETGEGVPETADGVPEEGGVVPETEVAESIPWYFRYIDLLMKAVLTALGTGLLWVMKKWFSDYKATTVYREAIEALEIGWNKTQEQFVVWTKRAAADGKLTADERAEARQMALDFAQASASGQARVLLATWGQDKVAALLAKITGKNKNAKTVVATAEKEELPNVEPATE